MRNKRDIYCEYHFWENFFEMEERISRNRDKRKIWDAFHDFLSNNNLLFDIPIQTIKSESPGGVRINELLQEKGGANIKFVPKEFLHIEKLSNSDDARLNSVFLTTMDTPSCENISERYGIIVLNLSMIFSASHVFVETKVPFDRTNGQNWSYLMDLKAKCPSISCCNSLVIVDRYLFSDKNNDVFQTNLKPIFEAILPQQLANDIEFTICIIAESQECQIEEKLLEFEELVKVLRPKLKFKLNIFNSWLHDRSILTNNIMLLSGAGFDVIGMENTPMKFTTTSLCFPYLQFNRSDNDTYLTWINNVLKRERRCRSYQVNYWGDKEIKHHLLDYYYIEPVNSINKTYNAKLSMPLIGFSNTSNQPKYVIGRFHKLIGNKGFVIQEQNGFRQQVRSIREGEVIEDGDIVEYNLSWEQRSNASSGKFWVANDVHLLNNS